MSEWISVDERLPDNYEWVLLFFSEAHSDPYVEIGLFNNGKISYPSSNGVTYEHTKLITHWMPLPEPPAGQNV